MEFLPYYFMFGAIIFVFYGIKTHEWGTAFVVALLWPLWVGYLVISLLWGIGSIW